jgi:hypothetical protein
MRVEVPRANNAEDVKGPRTILLVAAAQITLTAFSDEIQDFRRIS